MGNTTGLTPKGPLPTGYCAVAHSPRHARSHASRRLHLLLPVSTVAAAVFFSGVTRAALAQSRNSATAALNARASFAKASFDAESSAAMNRMMAGMEMNPTGDVCHDFVALMVPHHQGAIDMAEAELRYGRNEQLRRVAQQIVVGQVQEIAAMRIAVGEEVSRDEALLAASMPSASVAPASAGVAKSARSLKAEAPFIAENNSAMEGMMKGMTITPSDDVDHEFVALMVPHHQGAIDMAEAELRHGGNINPRLGLIAREIIIDQKQEITLMRLAAGEALPPSASSQTDRSRPPTRE